MQGRKDEVGVGVGVGGGGVVVVVFYFFLLSLLSYIQALEIDRNPMEALHGAWVYEDVRDSIPPRARAR